MRSTRNQRRERIRQDQLARMKRQEEEQMRRFTNSDGEARITGDDSRLAAQLEADGDWTEEEVANPVDATSGNEVEPTTATERPNDSDTKADWVDYAVTQGYDTSEDLTKNQLIEQYG